MVSNANSGNTPNYVGNTDGAPPLPPVGGYPGASRAALTEHELLSAHNEQVDTATIDPPAAGQHWLGWAAVTSAAAFAIVLGLIVLVGTPGGIFNLTAVVTQLFIVALIVAALVTKRARRLGIAALTIALVVNVATMGSLGALQISANGSYSTEKSAGQKHSQGFPGVDGYSKSDILNMPSLEDERAHIEALFEDVRNDLSRQYGVTWTKTGTEEKRLMRNGRGGESMLYTVVFDSWTTNEPVHDLAVKEQMLTSAATVMRGYGYYEPRILNLDDGTIPEAQITNLYGGAVPEDQVVWSRVTWKDWRTPSAVYLEITDLSRDDTGDFRKSGEARRANPSDPIEGFTLSAFSEPLLAEADTTEFEERMRAY